MEKDNDGVQAPGKIRNVMVIDYRPAGIPREWGSTDKLIQDYMTVLQKVSQKALTYKVVSKKRVANYPVLSDGRQYNDTTWNQARLDDKTAMRDANGSYMLADYQRILQEFKILPFVQNSAVHEVWLFGGPYFGFYESRMAGKGAFWCNSPGLEVDSRRFVIMGFSVERGLREMVHNFGHRSESILAMKYNSQNFQNLLYRLQPTPAPTNEFETWLLEHGTVHRKPGGNEYEQDEIGWVTALKAEWWQFIIDPEKVQVS